jgi:hypothetical protein
VGGDFTACFLGAAFSMPLNQSFNFIVTATPEVRLFILLCLCGDD